VGIFVVVGIIALTYFTVRVGRIAVREAGYRVYAQVESAAGLDKNSPVRIAGVEVGKVESIALDGTKAKITLQLPLKVKIPAGSKVYVKSAGLLGEKYIEIAAGAGSELVKADGALEEGGPAVDVDRVLTQLSAIGGDIQAVTHSLKSALGGEKGEKSIKEVVANTEKTMANLQNITQTIERGEGTFGKLVKDEKLYREVQETVGSLKQTASALNQVALTVEKGEGTLGRLVKDETLYREAKETVASLNQVAKSIEKGEGTLGKLVKDEALYVQTKETMEEAKQTLAALNKVSQQIEKGEGTLGKLVKDETLYEDARRMVKAATKAAEGLDETTPVTVLGVVLGAVLAR
jgi:phospholipid/cholesterol/gamma-HCH transport system substrate-binding protein